MARPARGRKTRNAHERLLAALAAEPDPPTTVREGPAAWNTHIADSLSGLEVPVVRTAWTIADVGAGAGFPGLPIAIELPDARVDLIESTARKCAVIERLAAAAGIENARAIPMRAEEWAAGAGRETYDAVLARAVASLAVLAEYASPLLVRGGVLVAWKGAVDAEEERAGDAAASELGLGAANRIDVKPFEEARDRRLYVYEKVAPTPEGYPRRPGMAAKRPLG